MHECGQLIKLTVQACYAVMIFIFARVTHHYSGHYEDWHSDQPEEPHNDEHTTSSTLVCAWIVLKELGTIGYHWKRGVENKINM